MLFAVRRVGSRMHGGHWNIAVCSLPCHLMFIGRVVKCATPQNAFSQGSSPLKALADSSYVENKSYIFVSDSNDAVHGSSHGVFVFLQQVSSGTGVIYIGVTSSSRSPHTVV